MTARPRQTRSVRLQADVNRPAKGGRYAFLCVLLALFVPFSSSRAQEPQREIRIGVLRPGGGYTVQTFPLETYIARVLAGEAGRDSRPAALEALAITIRTFALANPGRHNADGFDLCDQTHCQVMRSPAPAHERAAQATAGRALLRNGVPAPVFYSASCGGQTEIPSAVWPGHEDPSYMPSQPDDACMGSPAWTAEIEGDDLTRALRAGGFRGDRLRDFRVLSRDVSGRVARLRVAGFVPEEISGQDLRAVVGRTLGWQYIKSAAFELERIGDTKRFEGRGSGHGVGLCVIGSMNLAVAGRTATEILNRYFPGLEIAVPATLPSAPAPAVVARGRSTTPAPAAVRVAPSVPLPPPPTTAISAAGATGATATAVASGVGGVALALPDEDEGDRDSIAQLTGQARSDIALALRLAAPARVTVRFHPTTASYERATGKPWFTSGTLVGGELHLVPLASLRERGVLDRTIRHELVHLMADPILRERAAWVREGAAIYFAGWGPVPGDARPTALSLRSRLACPGDADLLRPVSPGSLSNALASSLACFSRQMDTGKSWRDVK
jgi:SpoIID/LytB domain protein